MTNEYPAAYTADEVERIAYAAVKSAMRSVLPNLDSDISPCLSAEKEDNMPRNTSKIRRHVNIRGTDIWICADSEQDYIDKVMKLGGFENALPRRKHLFETYAMNWFNTFSKPNVEPITALTYERQLTNHILPAFKGKYLEEIDVDAVQELFNSMGADAKLETKKKVKTVLTQIFKRAYDDRLIDRDPMKSGSLKIKGAKSDVTQPYTVKQMQYLMQHLPNITNPYDRAWLALSISLPLRPEEVLGLQWKNVDSENNTVTICCTVTHPARNEAVFKEATKTDQSRRTLNVPPDIMAFLTERGEPDDFVVGGKTPLSYTMLRRMRERIRKQIGFDDAIVPRRFRTTVATDISDMTHDIKLVQKMLGHSTPDITLKYYDKGRRTSADASEAIMACYSAINERSEAVS